MSKVFLEIILNAADASGVGIDSRDEVEDPLEEALSNSGLGEVTGGGGGMSLYIIDVEVVETQFEEALDVIRNILKGLKVPSSTKIKRSQPKEIVYLVYG